jgi:Uri superfamily endonuclease
MLVISCWNCVKRRKGSEQESKERWEIDYLDKLEFSERDIIIMIP